MQVLPHTRSCFVCGEANPRGLKMRFEAEGRIVRATFVPCTEHIGFKGVIHGGIIATVLDEIMVWACAVETRKFAYCAEMTVRFLHPMPPGATVLVSAELVTNRKNRLFEAKATAQSSDGVKFAEATGKYLAIKETAATAMVEDFVGDATWLNAGPPPTGTKE